MLISEHFERGGNAYIITRVDCNGLPVNFVEHFELELKKGHGRFPAQPFTRILALDAEYDSHARQARVDIQQVQGYLCQAVHNSLWWYVPSWILTII